jgi:hypothetical protein
MLVQLLTKEVSDIDWSQSILTSSYISNSPVVSKSIKRGYYLAFENLVKLFFVMRPLSFDITIGKEAFGTSFFRLVLPWHRVILTTVVTLTFPSLSLRLWSRFLPCCDFRFRKHYLEMGQMGHI